MGDDYDDKNGYDDDQGDLGEHILELCKLAQGNITTIYWCKQQLRKRLKILDRLVVRLAKRKDDDDEPEIERIEGVIKKQTDACKELGEKIQLEIESLDAIRIAAKSYGIDIKTRLLELDDSEESQGRINDILSDGDDKPDSEKGKGKGKGNKPS
jgi:hypothetical protein